MHTQNRFLSFCHLSQLSHNACMPQRKRHPSCLQKTPQSASEKYVSLPAKDSFPPAGKANKKKTLRLTDFHTLAPPAALYFPRKNRIFVSTEKRASKPVLSNRPIRKSRFTHSSFPAGIFPQI